MILSGLHPPKKAREVPMLTQWYTGKLPTSSSTSSLSSTTSFDVIVEPSVTSTGNLWTPAQLGSSLTMWLDANDASTLTLNGSTVSQWDDKSGNGFHAVQSTASYQPTYNPTGFNSKPSLFFDATNDLMACNATNSSSQADLFFGAAFQYLSDSTNWRPIVAHNTSETSSCAGTLHLQRRSTESEIGVHDSGRVDTGSAYTVQVTDLFEPRIATVGRNGGTNGQNGALTVTATGPSQPTYITQATQSWATSEATSRIQIGGRQQASTGWANAYISEVIVCNTDLSTADREKVEGYLAWKWGLEGELPAAHPYIDGPPLLDIRTGGVISLYKSPYWVIRNPFKTYG